MELFKTVPAYSWLFIFSRKYLKFTEYVIKLILKMSRRHLITSSDVFVIKGFTEFDVWWAYLNILHGEIQSHPQRMKLKWNCTEFILCSCLFYFFFGYKNFNMNIYNQNEGTMNRGGWEGGTGEFAPWILEFFVAIFRIASQWHA